MTPQTEALKAAEARFAQDDSLEVLGQLETVEAAYFARLAAVKAQWEGLEISEDVRIRAEANTADTEGTADDEIFWYEIALASAETILSYPD